MIFVYKSHLPARVKCLMKMGGNIITPRNLKYTKFPSQIVSKSLEPSFVPNEPKKESIYSYTKTTFNWIGIELYLLWFLLFGIHKN